MSFTIEDMILIAEKRYEMKFLAGKNGWANSISWVHLLEGTTIIQNFWGKELAVTTGLGFPQKEDWMHLARQLNQFHASGLIINVGQYIEEVPKELIAYCDENDLPLLTVPWEVHLSDMIKDFSIHVFLQDNTDEQIASALIKVIETPEKQNEYRKELLQHFDVDGSFQVFLLTCEGLDAMDTVERKKLSYRIQVYLEDITHNASFFYYNSDFVLVANAIPGNPWLSEKTPSEATIQALNAKYGLDQPMYVQLGKYLKNLAQGDFGTSIKMQKNRPVLGIIKEMFPVSAKVGSLALLWAVLLGIPLGCLAAFKRGTWIDSFLRVLCTIGISMPGFVVATLLLHTFCGGVEGIKVFPALFDGTPQSYVLPCVALGFYPMCYLSRQTRTSMLDAINQEYIKTARAKGLKNSKIIFKHALRNALIPVITYLGPQIAFTLCGGLVVETVFSIPGLGRYFVQAIQNRDYPLIMGTTIFLAAFIIIMNLLVDICYKLVDPRINLAKGGN